VLTQDQAASQVARRKSSQRRSSHQSKPQLQHQQESPQEASEEPQEMKKLIKMQFEQARMLMDLQKQFTQCQEIEKAHQLESMDQSMSRNFQDGTITSLQHSSKEDGSQIDPEEYKNIQHQGLIAVET